MYYISKIKLKSFKSYDDVTINFDKNFNDLNLANDCINTTKATKLLCDLMKIPCFQITIYPGYQKEANLLYGGGYHAFNIVKLDDKYYLIDCTYRQFFTTSGNFLERIGIIYTSGCKVGTFAIMNEERKLIASKLLKKGYIELTDDNLKLYLDPFTISYRNGLYYEITDDFAPDSFLLLRENAI